MKTQRASSKVLKNLLLILSVAMIAVSCGGENTSGKSGNNDLGIYGAYGTSNGVSGQQAMQVIMNENPCAQGGARQVIQVQLNQNVNLGAAHYGVTSYGDIAVAYGNSILEIHSCARGGQFAQQAQQVEQFVLESSTQCPVSQITRGHTALSSQSGQYAVIFRPIHIPNYGIQSQLCTNF